MSTSVAIKNDTRILIAEKQTELLKKGIKMSVGELADISIKKGLTLIDEKIKKIWNKNGDDVLQIINDDINDFKSSGLIKRKSKDLPRSLKVMKLALEKFRK